MVDRKSPDGPRPEDEGSPAVSDDVWDRFLQDSERDIRGSAPKEPSARARMVTARLREQEARGEVPEGWRTGPAWREMDGRAARRRRLWSVLGVLVAAAVAVVAIKPSLLPGDPFGKGGQKTADTSPLAPETAEPTGPAPSADPDTPTPDAPFAGSPALRWADGEAGIAPPKATAVGSFSKSQVALALRETKKLLVEANLDPATLSGRRPASALGVIEPQQKDLLTWLDTALRKPDEKHDPLAMFSRFDPEKTRIVGDVVKTRGHMTFKAGKRAASVAIHADYTFVYPVMQADDDSTEVTRTVVRRVLDIELADPARYMVTPGKISVVRYDQEIGNSACDVYDGYLHPQFSTAAPQGPDPTGPTSDPYDRSKGLDQNRQEGCGTVSRV